MWHGWHYRHLTGTWDRLVSSADRLACGKKLWALRPRPRTNLHLGLTQGGYPQWVPPHPDGDGARRDG